MLRFIGQLIFPIFSLAVLSGCGADVLTNDKLTVFGTTPIIEAESFQTVDLALLLRPMKSESGSSENVETNSLESAKTIAEVQSDIDSAFWEFNSFYGDDNSKGKRHRNFVQQRIVAASNQRCGEYKNFLKALDSRVNFGLGALTTAFASAGAIFTRANTVRVLSGIAAMISSTRAEFNQAYFANRTIQVLTDAFHTRRAAIQESMISKRKQSLLDYPVERAVGDAVRYHENCSLIAGLEVAALAVSRVGDPGVEQALKFQNLSRKLTLGADLTSAAQAQASAARDVGVKQSAVARAESEVESTQKKSDDATAKTPFDAAAKAARDAAKKLLDAAVEKLKESQSKLDKAKDRLAGAIAFKNSLKASIDGEETGIGAKAENGVASDKNVNVAPENQSTGAADNSNKTISVDEQPLPAPDKNK